LQLLHWNCKGALAVLSDILFLAKSYQIFCFQESLFLPISNFNVPGYYSIRSDITSSSSRGLCLLIRKDCRFSVAVVDLSNIIHSSIELQAILLYCSLDFFILIINLYRHPKIPFFFYSNLCAAVSAYKYAYILGDFNAHYHAWSDPRIDRQGEAVIRACDAFNLIVMNDGLSTFISSSGQASSTIDLSIASCDARILTSVSTLQDLHDSNHFPVSIVLAGTSPSTFRFSKA